MSIKASVYNQKGEKLKDKSLNESIFKVPAKKELIHQAMVCQMSNQRQVLAHTKGRADVRGGGAKPWRQKGTGRARAGSSRSPIWIGGGVTFGPTSDRNFKKKINKKMKQKAIFMAISDRIANDNFVILDELEIKENKTKKFNEIVENLEKKVLKAKENNKKRNILIINDSSDENIKLSSRNLQGVSVINLNNLNLLDLLKAKNLIISEEAVNKIEKKYKK